jgi:purine catabolism regulator
MERLSCSHQPTFRQLLTTEAMAEAHLVWGDDFVDRPVLQVVTQLDPPPSPGSLVLTTKDHLAALSGAPVVKGFTGVVLITAVDVEKNKSTTGTESSAKRNNLESRVVAKTVVAAHSDDPDVEKLLAVCRESDVPLFVLPGFGDHMQIIEDIRLAFLKETKTASARVQSILLSVVLEEGLDGLIDQLSIWLDRPVAIETADFKLLAARGMGSTPVRQQKQVMDQALDTLNSLREETEHQTVFDSFLYPVKLGRRVSLPLLYSGSTIAGYISVMVKPSDNEEWLVWYLQPAALAAMVDIIHRLKGDFGLSVVQKNLLKDLISGRRLSATDVERLETHFGFDLADGFYVFVTQVLLDDEDESLEPRFPEEPFIGVEVEETRVYIVRYRDDDPATWQEEAAELTTKIKEINGPCRVQLGSARRVSSLMELREAYREARQSLIVGSMMHGEGEFQIHYGELGLKRLLYLVIDHPEADRFYKETLALLEAYDEEWESELVDTLKVYLAEGANLNSAARALFIHRHTLRYRLEQIADILKVDIDSQEVLLNLNIAFLIREMKGQAEK